MCEACGASPRRPHAGPVDISRLCVHEIARGPLREKALDKAYAVLVVCWHCNGLMHDRTAWPEPAQLRLLRNSRPHDYDLVAYNALVNERAPNRITEDEVRIGAWIS